MFKSSFSRLDLVIAFYNIWNQRSAVSLTLAVFFVKHFKHFFNKLCLSGFVKYEVNFARDYFCNVLLLFNPNIFCIVSFI